MTEIFRTDRLVVRPWQAGDLDAVYAMNRDPDVTRYLPDHMSCATRDEARAWLDARIARHDPSSGLGFWAAIETETGQTVGGAVLDHAAIGDDNPVQVGYYFARSVWGRGYATELTIGLLRHGFGALGLDRIVAVTIPANAASCRVLEKAGMRNAGQTIYHGNQVALYELDHPE
ncbi:MAG TPA: GNAT family N-acetyltransferase [Thermomicrobiales bacterium]|nr:GNAT family N-acetyltransferase [Chloroflexota bacterium]HCG29269.1 GNAT family N-acetyltransferase [Chloroflexota bacterium]HQZ91231.1 GNAT family N-acetyltransferase [Thermomicrobiales bacterium]HRA32999.1 GNAT family N-acetyltransferase [Thermomicrobiales bacterium]